MPRSQILGGGAILSGPRLIWWNFVASSQERIEEAKAEGRAENWGRGRFDIPVGDRDEYIPPGLTALKGEIARTRRAPAAASISRGGRG